MAFKLISKIQFNIPEITEKNRNIFLGGGLLVIFLIDYFFFMQPLQLKPLVKFGAQIGTLTEDLDQSKDDIGKVGLYRKNVVDLRKKMEKVGKRILSREEIPEILDSVSRLAIESNVRINQIMPLRDTQKLILKNDEGRYYSFSTMVNARGSYHDIGRFFNKIEQNDVFMSIADFDIATNGDDPLHHTLKLTVKSFILGK